MDQDYLYATAIALVSLQVTHAGSTCTPAIVLIRDKNAGAAVFHILHTLHLV